MIMIPVSVGELIDKIVILEIKTERISDPQKRGNCLKEYQLLIKIAEENKVFFPQEKEALKKVNEEIWEIEDQLRKAEANKAFGEDFLKLTRSQYRANDKRAKIKRDINEKTDSDLFEEKDYVSYDSGES